MAVAGELAMRSGLRALVESILIVEEAVGNAREVDLGMMMGAGIVPGPLARPTRSASTTPWRRSSTPRRSGARASSRRRCSSASSRRAAPERPQDRASSPTRSPHEGEQTEVVLFETRGPVGIAWLKAKPVNPISQELVRDLEIVYDRAEADPEIKSLVIASANTAIFSAGANLKAFARLRPPKTSATRSTRPTRSSASSRPAA